MGNKVEVTPVEMIAPPDPIELSHILAAVSIGDKIRFNTYPDDLTVKYADSDYEEYSSEELIVEDPSGKQFLLTVFPVNSKSPETTTRVYKYNNDASSWVENGGIETFRVVESAS